MNEVTVDINNRGLALFLVDDVSVPNFLEYSSLHNKILNRIAVDSTPNRARVSKLRSPWSAEFVARMSAKAQEKTLSLWLIQVSTLSFQGHRFRDLQERSGRVRQTGVFSVHQPQFSFYL